MKSISSMLDGLRRIFGRKASTVCRDDAPLTMIPAKGKPKRKKIVKTFMQTVIKPGHIQRTMKHRRSKLVMAWQSRKSNRG